MRLLRELKDNGKTLHLATAASEINAHKVSEHLGIFTQVFSSNEDINLKGERKREALDAAFGKQGYCYFGDSWADLAVWKSARESFIVNAPKSLVETLKKSQSRVYIVDEECSSTYKNILKSMRVHHWVKNLLIFLPMFAGHQFMNKDLLFRLLIAALSFSLVASATYLINDLLDLEHDRVHPKKKFRPLASGALSVLRAVGIIAVLLGFAIIGISFLELSFSFLLVGYVCLSLLYSTWIKKIVLVDIFCLAFLYLYRIFVGSFLAKIPVSPWLFAFSLFIFLSLAAAKRLSELLAAERLQMEGKSRVPGRGYIVQDRNYIGFFGLCCALMSSVVFALYLQSQQMFMNYTHPECLWVLCVLILFWMSRFWLHALRADVDSDPVHFVLSDKVTYLMGVAALILGIMAI